MLPKSFILLTFVSVLLPAVYSCSDNEPANIQFMPEGINSHKSILAIELEHHFDNDPVWVILDDHLLLHEFITTDYTISAAWLSGPLEYETGDHRLFVGLTDIPVAAEHSFTLADTMTIRIIYNVENKEFSFFEQDGLFLERD